MSSYLLHSPDAQGRSWDGEPVAQLADAEVTDELHGDQPIELASAGL